MLDDLLRPDPGEVLAVSALTRQIKTLLEGSFQQFWVRGEVSNLRAQSSGHVYFSIKDEGSQLPCVLFARDAARQSFELSDGAEVILFGDLSVYEPHGRYQMIVKIAIEGGEGRLQAEFERLKRRLHAEGLFDPERKKELPVLPKRIGVVTSPTGAALRDFLQILERRDFRGDVTIFPARVQGKGASTEIARMLEYAANSEGIDLIVLTRGGGSIEDLWPFNEEGLARAVAACPVPIISAVGHQIDTVLTDFAADVRAETPSGAAELITSRQHEAWAAVEDAASRLQELVEAAIRDANSRTERMALRLRAVAPDKLLQTLSLRLDERETRLREALRNVVLAQSRRVADTAERFARHHPSNRLGLFSQDLRAKRSRLNRAADVAKEAHEKRLGQLAIRLENNGLQRTLDRGFVVLEREDGSFLTRKAEAKVGDAIEAKFADGRVPMRVEPKNK